MPVPKSTFKAEGKFFDNRIREDFAGDALYLGLMVGFGGAFLKRQEKVFTLPNIGNPFVIRAPERVSDRFALSIEDRSFQSDIDMGLHCVRL
jgi:hypothetical protein